MREVRLRPERRSRSRGRQQSPGRSGERRKRSRSRSRGNDYRSRKVELRSAVSVGDGGREMRQDKGMGRGHFGGGRDRDAGLRLPLRPGVDDDSRIARLEDDPRYFQGAEVGKAQKAAMGIIGLTGRNTASFDPASTLVRPGLRAVYGQVKKRYGQPIKHDDVVVVPHFMCAENDISVYESLVEEIREVQKSKDGDLSSLPTYQRAVSKLCKYFSMAKEDSGVQIVWFRKNSDQKLFEHETPSFKSLKKRGKNENCTAIISFGARREIAFSGTKSGETVHFPQTNGQLFFIGKDVELRWEHKANGRLENTESYGLVCVTICGRSSIAVEEQVLQNRANVQSETKPCRDFERGRCTYGERCQFSHGTEEKNIAKECDSGSGSTRPQMRIIIEPTSKLYSRPVKHDDVIIVPNFFCAEDDWEVYYKLIEEMRDSQKQGERQAEWISWHEGAHLLSKNPTGSRTYQRVIDRICEYFSIAEGNRGTRFNWYRDGSDWKPFHHDSAAFNFQRAKNQNCSIGMSFGASRELAFRHAKTGELIYFPQGNGTLFYFGRDVNITWQHGVNALPAEEQGGKGRISIVVWGWCSVAVDEEGSPPMLDDNSRGNGYDLRKGGGKGQGGKGSGMCRDFQRHGSCSYGAKCRFSHGDAKGGGA